MLTTLWAGENETYNYRYFNNSTHYALYKHKDFGRTTMKHELNELH